MLTPEICHQARLSRDPRFDGLFFIAVKSTGIFCRPICPARSPAEHQVAYFFSAAAAANAGFRPCLRCRPDSAPGSAAWQGTQTTLKRALQLIEQGSLQQQNQSELAERLGISERYLRKLFQQQFGIAPQRYALLQQVLFAKKLLHETSFSISQIAAQAGFNSLRRFNDAFKKELKMPPSQIRRHQPGSSDNVIELSLSYRPPLAWQAMLDFWQKRTLQGVEWVNGLTYGRTFIWQQQAGWFEVSPKEPNQLQLKLHWPSEQGLFSLIRQLRRLFDLDADINLIEQQLQQHPLFQHGIISGLRIPGIWDSWEAGVRAVLGQQVSVAAARTHLNRLVDALGSPLPGSGKIVFPSPAAVMHSELAMLKMPQRRKDTLRALATYMLQYPQAEPEQWLAIKGIGPWTVNYARMRGTGYSDIWLGGDLGIQKALQQLAPDNIISTDTLAPWRSYATFQLWFNTGD
ncbi:AlkA N-terminal domain-containing protein [Chromatiaceae bacterium AAb-1]|nr:AlkA N-terminal domain-containing protein [Chromatiaceae bacterium AAb-1]